MINFDYIDEQTKRHGQHWYVRSIEDPTVVWDWGHAESGHYHYDPDLYEEVQGRPPERATLAPRPLTTQQKLAALDAWFKNQNVAFRAKYLSAMVAVETSLRTGDIELAAYVITSIEVSDPADKALVAEALQLLGVEEGRPDHAD